MIFAPVLATVVAIGLLSGPSWACVPQPFVSISPQASGPAGTQVTVSAVAITGDVEVRWNNLQGMELGKGTGPMLSAPITIPDVPPGLYSVVILERHPDGGVGNTARAAFLVTGPGGVATPTTVIPEPKPASSRGGTNVALIVVGGIVLLGAVVAGGALGARGWRRPGRQQPPGPPS